MANKKPFIELQFSDAFMFAAAMEDEEICRGVRLDVYADDEEGTIFNVEMQGNRR